MPADFHSRLFEDLDIRGVLVQLSGAWAAMPHERGYRPQIKALLGMKAAQSEQQPAETRH